MVSKEEDKIDFAKLELEMQAAVEADAKYWRENDAKFRAVNQKVGTYEEFRDIVRAAHLRPLEKKDRMDVKAKKTQWNPCLQAPTDKDGIQLQGEQAQTLQSKDKNKSIKNSLEFSRFWRSLGNTTVEKYNFLLALGSTQIRRIFQAEISCGVLGEMIGILLKGCKSSDVCEILDILDAFSETNRFRLSLQFLSSGEKESCRQLLIRLMQESNEREEDDESGRKAKEMVTRLKILYEVAMD